MNTETARGVLGLTVNHILKIVINCSYTQAVLIEKFFRFLYISVFFLRRHKMNVMILI
jgi:hypothetical protein